MCKHKVGSGEKDVRIVGETVVSAESFSSMGKLERLSVLGQTSGVEQLCELRGLLGQ